MMFELPSFSLSLSLSLSSQRDCEQRTIYIAYSRVRVINFIVDDFAALRERSLGKAVLTSAEAYSCLGLIIK